MELDSYLKDYLNSAEKNIPIPSLDQFCPSLPEITQETINTFDEDTSNNFLIANKSGDLLTSFEETPPHPAEKNVSAVKTAQSVLQQNGFIASKKKPSLNKQNLNAKMHATKLIFKKKKYYICLDCDAMNNNFIEASNHFALNHLDSNCQIIDALDLSSHQDYSCNFPDCTIKTSCDKDLNKHKISHITDEKICPYPNCGKTYKIKTSLLSHIIKKHGNFLYQCTKCSKVLTNKYALNDHNKNWHNSIQCRFCQKKLKLGSLMQHLTGHLHSFSVEVAKHEIMKFLNEINNNRKASNE